MLPDYSLQIQISSINKGYIALSNLVATVNQAASPSELIFPAKFLKLSRINKFYPEMHSWKFIGELEEGQGFFAG